MAGKRGYIYGLLFCLFVCATGFGRQPQTFLVSTTSPASAKTVPLAAAKKSPTGGDTTRQQANSLIFNNVKLDKYNTPYTFNFTIINKPGIDGLTLYIEYHNVRGIKLYRLANGKKVEITSERESDRPHGLFVTEADHVYPLALNRDSAAQYQLDVTTFNPFNLSARVCTSDWISNENKLKIFTVSFYIGVMLATFFYNLFVFFSLRDKSYLYYCLYILFLCCGQVSSMGYGLGIFVGSHSFFDQYAVNLFTSIAFIAGLLFALYFLDVRKYLKKAAYLIWLILVSYIVVIFCSFLNLNKIAFALLNINALLTCFSLLIISYMVMRRGNNAAAYYLIAYVVLLAGLITYVLKNYGVIRQSWFVDNVIIIGSALEAILLSIALANRINILRIEKEQSQLEALQVSKENERLIKDQNITLEQSVLQRTEELSTANQQLSGALVSLKDAQTQLVDAEKMASLGQLTAGIAHEINNPINFVKSNINPLRLDIKDVFDVFKQYNNLHSFSGDAAAYKKQLQEIAKFQQQVDIDFIKDEITQLIKGIEDGAERTAEIVRGLRTFSRLDESELKIANVHEGINSTLVLIRNNIPFEVQVVKHFNAAGLIECYPGKLNQVFMNIITNGLQAIHAKPVKSTAEAITITTRDIEHDQIEISIKDSGTGMSEEVRHRVFEPFFTTKEVGEGTGLGMAIVFKIIEKHHGKITIISSPGNGAEFILTLPHTQPVS